MFVPLFSSEGYPIFGKLNRPVYGDGIIQTIKITISWGADDLDIAIGYTGLSGVGWNVPAGSAGEMGTLSWYGDNVTGGPEIVIVNAEKMIADNIGWNSSANSWDIRIHAGWYTYDKSGESCTVTAEGMGTVASLVTGGLPNNNQGPATNLVAYLRVSEMGVPGSPYTLTLIPV